MQTSDLEILLAMPPVSQRPLRDLIKEKLLDLIVQGALRPGARLIEAELATHLNTSRIPVREALQALQRDLWVDILPRQGARVHVPTMKEIEDVFGVRAALEGECAFLAAAAPDPEAIQQLQIVIEEGLAAATANDNVTAATKNSQFHRLITESSGNRIMVETLGRMELRIRWYFSTVAEYRGVQSWVEHQAILDAIAAGEGTLARRESRMHANQTLEILRRHHHGELD